MVCAFQRSPVSPLRKEEPRPSPVPVIYYIFNFHSRVKGRVFLVKSVWFSIIFVWSKQSYFIVTILLL